MYVDMRANDEDFAPSWTLQYALLQPRRPSVTPRGVRPHFPALIPRRKIKVFGVSTFSTLPLVHFLARRDDHEVQVVFQVRPAAIELDSVGAATVPGKLWRPERSKLCKWGRVAFGIGYEQ